MDFPVPHHYPDQSLWIGGPRWVDSRTTFASYHGAPPAASLDQADLAHQRRAKKYVRVAPSIVDADRAAHCRSETEDRVPPAWPVVFESLVAIAQCRPQ